MDLLERFLTYVSFDTQSDENSDSYPSTLKQLDLLRYLSQQAEEIGLSEVRMDEYGYVTATIPATAGREDDPVIGFLAHVDTSPDMSGSNIKPQIIKGYDGSDIKLGDNAVLSRSEFPDLNSLLGHTLITTSGDTLLGADDKAGVAEIMTAAEYLVNHPEIGHGKIRIAFTPDEEVGRGVDYFDVASFGADYAYTVDGGVLGELEYENFNAAEAELHIQGRNIHPGYAKDKMINALEIACELSSLIDEKEKPQNTEGYEGFFHLHSMSGNVEFTRMNILIRDHCINKFRERKEFLFTAADTMKEKYKGSAIEVKITDQYYNMLEMIKPHPIIIERAVNAMKTAGIEPLIRPIRGGTDGARLSYMGLPCPNIFTGGMNFHGRYECCSLDVMYKAVETIINIAVG